MCGLNMSKEALAGRDRPQAAGCWSSARHQGQTIVDCLLRSIRRMTDLLAPVLACGSFQYGKGPTCCILLERLEQRGFQFFGGYCRRRCI